MKKNDRIVVKSEMGRGIECPIVDYDSHKGKLWVRLPTNDVLEMNFIEKRKVFVGKMARLEFTANPKDVIEA